MKELFERYGLTWKSDRHPDVDDYCKEIIEETKQDYSTKKDQETFFLTLLTRRGAGLKIGKPEKFLGILGFDEEEWCQYAEYIEEIAFEVKYTYAPDPQEVFTGAYVKTARMLTDFDLYSLETTEQIRKNVWIKSEFFFEKNPEFKLLSVFKPEQYEEEAVEWMREKLSSFVIDIEENPVMEKLLKDITEEYERARGEVVQ